jgi:hypothetical protein
MIEETETRGGLMARQRKPVDPTGWDTDRGKEPDDIYIRAEIRGPAHQLLKLYRKYFETI